MRDYTTWVGQLVFFSVIVLGIIAIAIDLIKRGDNSKGGVTHEKKVRPGEKDARRGS